MRKISVILIAAMLLTGCSAAGIGVKKDWKADLESHWTLDEAGNEQEKGAHKWTKNICNECSAELVEYPEWGESQIVMKDNGYVTYVAMYNNGEFFVEQEYVYEENEKNEKVLAKSFQRQVNGDYSESDHDEYGSILSTITYNAEGTVIDQSRYEYEYNEDGLAIESKYYIGIGDNEKLQNETTYAVGTDGAVYVVKDIYYEPLAENYVVESEFNEEGEIIKITQIENGVIFDIAEREYVYDSNDEVITTQITHYNADGIKTSYEEENADGTILFTIYFDEKGNFKEYSEFDAQMYPIRSITLMDYSAVGAGKTIEERQYVLGEMTMLSQYFKDEGKTHIEKYDASGETTESVNVDGNTIEIPECIAEYVK